MFAREDAGYGMNQGPTGYVKIEVRDQKGKLQVSVQDIKEDQDRLNYKLYIIKCDNKLVCPVYAGMIPIKKNKGELQWEFNPDNVDMTGNAIDDFNVFALMVEYSNREYREITCPLAAYRGDKVLWRERTRNLLYPEKVPASDEDDSEVIRKKDLPDIFQVENLNAQPLGVMDTTLVQKPVETVDEDSGKAVIEQENAEYDDTGYEDAKSPGEMLDANSEELYGNDVIMDTGQENHVEPDYTAPIDAGETGYEQDQIAADEQFEDDVDASAGQDDKEPAPEVESSAGKNTGADEYTRQFSQDEKGGSQRTASQGFENCIYKYSNFCSFRTPFNGYNPCANCYLYKSKSDDGKAENTPGNINLFKKSMDKYFETCDPFGSRRRDYRWWKIGNPAYLNNVLYQCNIKTPLLFNPKVMMAHFKYRHLIVGVYTDRMRRFECIVCGVPGVYNIDDKPFGDMCRWVQVEGNRPRYGAFGYWLVYVDPKTGNFLSFR